MADHRDGRVAGVDGFLREAREVVQVGVRRGPYRRDARRGHDTHLGFGLGQRRFDVEHRLQLRPAVEPPRQVGVAEQAGVQAAVGAHAGHTSKKTVSCGPCRAMSKR